MKRLVEIDDATHVGVPRVATLEMIDAAFLETEAENLTKPEIANALGAAIAAAPTPPASAQSVSASSATVQVDPSAPPLTLAPFANCKFRECDLPGQCRGEGRCHHPASGERGAQSVEPAAWSVESRAGGMKFIVRDAHEAEIHRSIGRTVTPLYTTPPSAQSVEPVTLADAIIREMCELCDRTSPEDEPDAMVANAQEMHGCVERALETLGLYITSPSAEGTRDAVLAEVMAMIVNKCGLGNTMVADVFDMIGEMQSKKEAQ